MSRKGRHRRIVALCLPFFLAACADLTPPFAIDIKDQAAYDADLKDCTAAAKAYHKSLSLGAVASGAVIGGAQNAAGAAVNPLVPAIGALGGATTAAVSGIDALGLNQQKVLNLCMDRRGERSRAYLVLEPTN